MRHRDTDMIIMVYGKYIENLNDLQDGNNLTGFYQGKFSKDR